MRPCRLESIRLCYETQFGLIDAFQVVVFTPSWYMSSVRIADNPSDGDPITKMVTHFSGPVGAIPRNGRISSLTPIWSHPPK
jgi:hypothetical protein